MDFYFGELLLGELLMGLVLFLSDLFSFSNGRGTFFGRTVHTNHEISTRRSKFTSVFGEAWYGFSRVSFHHSQTDRFLVGYCEKGLTHTKNTPKRNIVWEQAVSGD